MIDFERDFDLERELYEGAEPALRNYSVKLTVSVYMNVDAYSEDEATAEAKGIVRSALRLDADDTDIISTEVDGYDII